VEELDRIGQGQFGLVTSQQFKDCKVAPSTKSVWRTKKRIDQVQPRVYRLAGAPRTWESRLLAACLSSGGWASHLSCARLWNMSDSDDLHVTIPHARRARLTDVTVHRSSDVAKEHKLFRNGIPTLTPMRALVDIGAVADAAAVEDALDRALVQRLFVIASVERALAKLAKPGRSGAGVLRAVLDERALRDGIPDGLLEPRMARLVKKYGLPMPVFQHRVYSKGGVFLGRVDFAYPELRIAIEVDGWEAHSTPAQLDQDLARQNQLILNGWTVLRFSWKRVVLRPAEVAAQIAAALGAEIPA
jgi:hypothetical protein